MGRQFEIDPDVEALVAELARPAPFESFSDALRGVLLRLKGPDTPRISALSSLGAAVSEAAAQPRLRTAEELLAEFEALPSRERERYDERYQLARRERAPSPEAQPWAAKISELRDIPGLNTWKAICGHLDIETAGDSARRKLQKWVQQNRPNWIPVPEPPPL